MSTHHADLHIFFDLFDGIIYAAYMIKHAISKFLKVQTAVELPVTDQTIYSDRLIEQAIRDQTKCLLKKHDTLITDMHRRYMNVVFAILAVGMAIVVAVLLR